MAGAKVRLLGGLEIDGHHAGELGSRKARTMLAALALARGRPVPADRLADILWQDDVPSRPADQLGVLVSRVRRVLGADALPRARGGYQLPIEWLDLDELHRRVAEAGSRLQAGQPGAARAAADAAIELAQRAFLPDEDGEWVGGERLALDRAVARARSIAAEVALAVGDPGSAAVAAEAALDHDPYDEAALRLLMRAHVAAARPASALAAYGRSRERLADELGVSPSPETEALHTSILLGDVPALDPRPEDAIVGRTGELVQLERLLDGAVDGRVAVVSIEGGSGIGKTALLRAFLVAARRRVAIVDGRCDVLGRDLPLQPVLDGLDVLLTELGPEMATGALGDDARLIGPLLSSAGSAMSSDSDRLVPPGDPAAARALWYAALARVVHRIGEQHGGIVVAVDDIHQAGNSTLEWLQLIGRRGGRLMVVVTRRAEGPTIDGATRIRLGPLTIEDAVVLCGAERAAELHARAAGNPLFLKALASTDPNEVPSGVRQLVADRLAGLGAAATTVVVAAVLGSAVDLDVIADATDQSARAVLDDLDAGLRAGLLSDRPDGLAFTHELIRETIAATASASRQAFVHREAGRSLARRPRHDPLAAAWHARLGRDLSLAAAELVVAARIAATRHDLAVAEQLVAESLALEPMADAALAQVQFLMARGAFGEAAEAAGAAIALGAGAAGFEAAGWVAYYARDPERALRAATDGAQLTDDAHARVGCLALAGRILHSLGRFAESEEHLVVAVDGAPPGQHGMPRVWLGGLRVHQGRGHEALALVDAALLDPGSIRHPFAEGHGHFARSYALGQLGRPAELLAVIDGYEAVLVAGDPLRERFGPVHRNQRSWVARSLGALDEADELSVEARELATFPNLAEPRVHAQLDLVETALLRGDADGAARHLADAEAEPAELGTMLWARYERAGLLRARLALLCGEHERAQTEAAEVVRTAAERGSRRHEVAARLVMATAGAASGAAAIVSAKSAVRFGAADPNEVELLLGELDQLAGMEAWRWTADAAAAFGVDRWQHAADQRLAALAAAAGDRSAALTTWATRYLDRSPRPPRPPRPHH